MERRHDRNPAQPRRDPEEHVVERGVGVDELDVLGAQIPHDPEHRRRRARGASIGEMHGMDAHRLEALAQPLGGHQIGDAMLEPLAVDVRENAPQIHHDAVHAKGAQRVQDPDRSRRERHDVDASIRAPASAPSASPTNARYRSLATRKPEGTSASAPVHSRLVSRTKDRFGFSRSTRA